MFLLCKAPRAKPLLLGRDVREYRLQLLLPVGPSISHFPRILLLPAKVHLAQDGGRPHEAVQEGNHGQVMKAVLISIVLTNWVSRFIEDQDEKREKLVQFFCRNIHNK